MKEYECPQCEKPRPLKREPHPSVVCKNCKYENTLKDKQATTKKRRVCEDCGDVREVHSAKEEHGNFCRSCYLKQGIENRTRICEQCGDSKVMKTARDAQSKRCRKCVNIGKIEKKRKTQKDKENERQSKADKKLQKKIDSIPVPRIRKEPKKKFARKARYIYLCSECPDIKFKTNRRKGSKCLACSRKKKEAYKIYFDFKDMLMKHKGDDVKIRPPKIRHFRICPHCPKDEATVEVKFKSYAGIRKCNKHKFETLPGEIKKVRKKYDMSNRVSKTPSDEAIKAAQKKNREHREAQKEKKEIPQRKTDEEMKKDFLKDNKPSVQIPKKEKFPHLEPKMIIDTTY